MFTKRNTAVLISLFFILFSSINAEDILSYFKNISPEQLKEYQKAKAGPDREKELVAISNIYHSERDKCSKESILKFLSEASELAASYNNKDYYQRFLKGKANIYYRLGEYGKAEKEFTKLLNFAETEKNLSLKAQMNSNIGVLLEIQGQYNEAIKRYLDAWRTFEKLKKYRFSGKVLHNIAVLYAELKDTENAILYFNKALKFKRIDSTSRELGATLNGLGTIYEGALQEFDKALKFYTEALALYQKEQDFKFSTKVLGNIGLVYFQKKEFKKADEYYSRAMANVEKYSVNNSYKPSIFFNIAMLRLRTGKLQEAVKNFKESIKYCKQFKKINKNIDAHKYLAEAYKKSGDFKNALLTLEEHNKLREKVYNETIQKQVSTLQKKFDTEKKNKQIELLSKENEIKSNRLKFSIMFLIFLVVAISLLIYLIRMKIRQNRVRENDLKQKLLKAQMNPHFLFNALSTIQYLIHQQETAKAHKYLGKFAALTRSILENSEKDFISLDEEIEMLRSYLDLESLCRNGSFDYFIDLDSNLETEEIMIPPMLIQPFVENAVKHAFKNCDAGNHIELSFHESLQNSISIRISDNGSGISPKGNMNKPHKSMSMEIFRKRVALFEKRYKCKVNHKVRNLNGIEGTGTEISITLPVIGEQ